MSHPKQRSTIWQASQQDVQGQMLPIDSQKQPQVWRYSFVVQDHMRQQREHMPISDISIYFA
jgi:hypothetical protein